MNRRCIIVGAIVLAAWSTHTGVSAQRRWLHRVDSMLTARYNQSNIDSAYIGRPDTRWTVKGRWNISGAGVESDGIVNGTTIHTRLRADYKLTASTAISYCGVAIGLALNPMKLSGKGVDYEFNMNAYGNRYGMDVVYQASRTLSGTVENDGTPYRVDKGLIHSTTLNVNAYYAFNGRRFSYPAAFTQSYEQRRSAGSWLVGISFFGLKTTTSHDEVLGNPAITMKVTNLGIGGGYGYNLVVGHNWLFHLSSLPTFVVYNRSRSTVDDVSYKFPYRFPQVIITGRGAVVYSWRRAFVGETMVFNFSTIGNYDQLLIKNTKWRIRAFCGFRF
ncbi:MAG: DUF4421 family protein [Prevotella sp.]|nr:DUF4421 family protein [Prevotella sp.]